MDEKLTKAQMKEQRKQERQEWEQKMAKDQQMKGLKKLGIWVGALAIVAVSVWGLIALVNAPSAPTTPTMTAPAVTSSDMTLGPKNAKVTLIEYADFQCPACAAYHPLINQLMKDYDGKVLFVYRFFPLTTIHRNGFASATAGYAAYLQGKFWQMDDQLFNHQNDWAEVTDPTSIYVGYAKDLGMDTAKFTADMQAQSTKDFINKEEDAGTAIGINSTPTFFINGKSIQNPQSYDAFKQHIQDALDTSK